MARSAALVRMPQGVSRRSAFGLAGLALLASCSASSGPGSSAHGSGNQGHGGVGAGVAGGPVLATGGGGLNIDLNPSGSATAGTGGGDSCATKSADAMVERQPVDIVVVIDNSGSMQEEI